jgi:MinD-like ATPase involved in chromosome partitioning or flagellar assembly
VIVVLIVLGSAKGSPGVTTVAVAVAVAAPWPQPGAALVVELDLAGGDLGSR